MGATAVKLSASGADTSESCLRRALTAFQSNAWRGGGYSALFTHVCSANHSCCPNARVELGSGGAQLIALRSIISGEEVTVSYAHQDLLLQSVEGRRQTLAST